MENAATPTVPANGSPTVTPVATPAVEPEKVTLTKAEYDQLSKDASRAASSQRKAMLYDRITGGKAGGNFRMPAPAAPAPTAEEAASAAAEEDRKAERGLMALALDPKYREVLDNDATLRDMLTKNPLAVLPILAPDALDAEDAISLVTEALGKRVKSATTPAKPPATAPAPSSVPPAGGVNPQNAPANDDYEAARKIPKTESAIATMIAVKMKGGKQ